MLRARGTAVISLALLACTPAPAGDSEDGGVTTDPSGSGVTTLDTLDTSDTEDPPDPTTTGTTGEPPPPPPPPPILDFGGDTGEPNPGSPCTSDSDCVGGQCYIIPFLGGLCGECNEDADCDGGGCTAPNPFAGFGAYCNFGEPGGGCESDAVCQPGLVCDQVFDLLGLIVLDTCGFCRVDADCQPGELCVARVDFAEFAGVKTCMLPGGLGQDEYCELQGNGDQACASGICSLIDIMGLAEVGACGSCTSNADCNGGTCVPGEFVLDTGQLIGSSCQ